MAEITYFVALPFAPEVPAGAVNAEHWKGRS
jgi:hypothetical protein